MTRFGRLTIPFLPALLAASLLASWFSGTLGGYAAFAVTLVAPGWLIWRILPDSALDWDEPVGLPALWLVLSFTVLSPAVGGLVYFGWSVFVVEWYLLVVLVGLGLGQFYGPRRTAGRWDVGAWVVLAVTLAGFAYRTSIWRVGTDDHTYIGYLRAFAATGRYPTTNPFMSGDVPLAPRWRLDAWTGTTGVLSHLGNLDPRLFFRSILPGLMVLFVGSALFLLARALSGSRVVAHMAAISALIIPIITDTTRYRSIGYNKFSALYVFLPVIAALMLYVYRTGRRGVAVLAAAAFWGAIFVHPVPALWVAALLAGFIVVDGIATRKVAWPLVGLVGAAMIPMILTAFIVSSTGEKFGVRLGDIDDLSLIAAPDFDIGPITIWEPRVVGSLFTYTPETAAAAFVLGHVNGPEGPRLMFLSNGMPMAHWRMLFSASGDWLVGLALVLIVFGRYRDDVALWIVASTLVSVSVFLLPPLAAIVGRFITPWQLWRFSWLMPVALSAVWLVGVWLPRVEFKIAAAAVILAAVGLTYSTASPRFRYQTSPSPSYEQLQDTIEELADYDGVFLLDTELRSQASSDLQTFKTVAFSGLTHMSNGFPSKRRAEAFDRLLDTRVFYGTDATTQERAAILEQHNVDYVLVQNSDRKTFDFPTLDLELVRPIGDDVTLYQVAGTGGQ